MTLPTRRTLLARIRKAIAWLETAGAWDSKRADANRAGLARLPDLELLRQTAQLEALVERKKAKRGTPGDEP